MRKIKFISECMQPGEDEMIIYSSRYIYGNGVYLEAWDEAEPYAEVTENVPEIPLGENEVVLNHDLLSCSGFDGRDFLGDFLEYLTTGSREVIFGPYNTKTLVVRLKDDWQSLCVPMEVRS